METMTKLARGVLLGVSACLLASPASAQLHDHLKCYKVKDAASFSATVDLQPANLTFEADAGCTIKVRSREVCFPVEKDLLTTTSPQLDIHGADLTNAYLCYKIRCPETTLPPTLQMSDQFGTHGLSGLRTSTVCTPAIVGTPPVTTTTTSTLPTGPIRQCIDATPPNCDGTCNNYNFACKEDAGACICAYVDVFGGCPMLGGGAPNCWGSCEGSQTCIEVSGACQCGFAFE
jgi:hypothetical protein